MNVEIIRNRPGQLAALKTDRNGDRVLQCNPNPKWLAVRETGEITDAGDLADCLADKYRAIGARVSFGD